MKGKLGPKGSRGTDGEDGTQGLPGADGMPGKAGNAGAVGERGPQGLPGRVGLPGEAGKTDSESGDGMIVRLMTHLTWRHCVDRFMRVCQPFANGMSVTLSFTLRCSLYLCMNCYPKGCKF